MRGHEVLDAAPLIASNSLEALGGLQIPSVCHDELILRLAAHGQAATMPWRPRRDMGVGVRDAFSMSDFRAVG